MTEDGRRNCLKLNFSRKAVRELRYGYTCGCGHIACGSGCIACGCGYCTCCSDGGMSSLSLVVSPMNMLHRAFRMVCGANKSHDLT